MWDRQEEERGQTRSDSFITYQNVETNSILTKIYNFVLFLSCINIKSVTKEHAMKTSKSHREEKRILQQSKKHDVLLEQYLAHCLQFIHFVCFL